MGFLRLLGNKVLTALLSVRVFWRPMLLLAVVAHVFFLRARFPKEEVAIETPPEEEFIEITALVGDGAPGEEPSDEEEPLGEEEPPEEGSPEEGSPEEEPPKEEPPQAEPKPKPEPDPQPKPKREKPESTEKAKGKGETEDTASKGDEGGGDEEGGDEEGGDEGDSNPQGGGNAQGEGAGVLNQLKAKVKERLLAGTNDPETLQQELDTLPPAVDVNSSADKAILCPGQQGSDVCDPVEYGGAFGALRLPQTTPSQAGPLVRGILENTFGLSMESAGKLGSGRDDGTLYRVTGSVEFYMGQIKVFGGTQIMIVLWETNPLES